MSFPEYGDVAAMASVCEICRACSPRISSSVSRLFFTNIHELVERPIISSKLNARISFPCNPISARNCFHAEGRSECEDEDEVDPLTEDMRIGGSRRKLHR